VIFQKIAGKRRMYRPGFTNGQTACSVYELNRSKEKNVWFAFHSDQGLHYIVTVVGLQLTNTLVTLIGLVVSAGARKIVIGGQAFTWGPTLLLISYLPLPLRSRPPKIQLGGLGGAVSSRSRVWGRAPADKRFGTF